MCPSLSYLGGLYKVLQSGCFINNNTFYHTVMEAGSPRSDGWVSMSPSSGLPFQCPHLSTMPSLISPGQISSITQPCMSCLSFLHSLYMTGTSCFSINKTSSVISAMALIMPGSDLTCLRRSWHGMLFRKKKKQLSEGSMKTATLQVAVSGRAIGTPIFSQPHRGVGDGASGMLSPSISFQINMLKATTISYYYTICLSLFCLPTAPRSSLLMTLTPLSEIKGKQKQQIYPPYKTHTLESDYSSRNPECTVVDSVACIWT